MVAFYSSVSPFSIFIVLPVCGIVGIIIMLVFEEVQLLFKKLF